MAVVVNTYIKAGKKSPVKVLAKANIRYIMNRKSKEGRTTRNFFGKDELTGKIEAYRMIDEAAKGSIFFRFIISPDPEKEDKENDLDLRQLTEKTMQSLEGIIHNEVKWVSAEHDDHTDNRHTHTLAIVPRRLNREEFAQLAFVLRDSATYECLEQRAELDQLRERQKSKERGEEEEWDLGY